MKKIFRCLYLNTYPILITLGSLAVIAAPFYLISKWFLIPQIIVALIIFVQAYKIFSGYPAKIRSYNLLMEKNSKGFREDSFVIYMKAPCGRLLTRAVLKDLGMKDRYKDLKKYIPSLKEMIKQGCEPAEESVYINDEALDRLINKKNS